MRTHLAEVQREDRNGPGVNVTKSPGNGAFLTPARDRLRVLRTQNPASWLELTMVNPGPSFGFRLQTSGFRKNGRNESIW